MAATLGTDEHRTWGFEFTLENGTLQDSPTYDMRVVGYEVCFDPMLVLLGDLGATNVAQFTQASASHLQRFPMLHAIVYVFPSYDLVQRSRRHLVPLVDLGNLRGYPRCIVAHGYSARSGDNAYEGQVNYVGIDPITMSPTGASERDSYLLLLCWFFRLK